MLSSINKSHLEIEKDIHILLQEIYFQSKQTDQDKLLEEHYHCFLQLCLVYIENVEYFDANLLSEMVVTLENSINLKLENQPLPIKEITQKTRDALNGFCASLLLHAQSTMDQVSACNKIILLLEPTLSSGFLHSISKDSCFILGECFLNKGKALLKINPLEAKHDLEKARMYFIKMDVPSLRTEKLIKETNHHLELLRLILNKKSTTALLNQNFIYTENKNMCLAPPETPKRPRSPNYFAVVPTTFNEWYKLYSEGKKYLGEKESSIPKLNALFTIFKREFFNCYQTEYKGELLTSERNNNNKK